MILSRLKWPSLALWSNSLICAAIRIFRSSKGKPPSGPTPTRLERQPAQHSATVVPIGVTTPMPVTTTRRGAPDMTIYAGFLCSEQKAGRLGRQRGAPHPSSLSRGRSGTFDQTANALHHRPDGLEIRGFFIGVVGDFDTEGVLDVEHDHGKIEGLDLQVRERGREPNVIPGLFHMFLQDIDNLTCHLVHCDLPIRALPGKSGPLLADGLNTIRAPRMLNSRRHIYGKPR